MSNFHTVKISYSNIRNDFGLFSSLTVMFDSSARVKATQTPIIYFSLYNIVSSFFQTTPTTITRMFHEITKKKTLIDEQKST